MSATLNLAHLIAPRRLVLVGSLGAATAKLGLLLADGARWTVSATTVSLVTFLMIGSGVIGCVLGPRSSSRAATPRRSGGRDTAGRGGGAAVVAVVWGITVVAVQEVPSRDLEREMAAAPAAD